MALAAVAIAKAMRRRQIMVATSSIGPGATNMVTAAGVAHANRLPVLLISGETFQSRIPDPVLQQVEHFGDPTITVNDALQAGHPLLGPHHPARAGGALAARTPWRRCSTRPRAARRSSPCHRTCRPSRTTTPSTSSTSPCTRSPRPRADLGQLRARRRGDPVGRAAAHHLRRRRALLGCRGRAAGVRRGAQHPRRRDGGRQGVAARVAPAQCRPGRCHRMRGRQRARRRGRRGDRGRHPPAGLHHRLVDRLRRVGPIRRHQRRRVRRDQALATARHRRRPRGAPRAHAAARRLGRAQEWTDQACPRDAGLPRVHRQDRRAGRDRPARPMPRSSVRSTVWRDAHRLRPHGCRRVPRRAEQRLAGEGPRQLRRRVRLLVHGLRDLRRLGRQDGDARPRGHRVRRRRLVHDDELRPVLVGAGRPQADRARVRQRRVRRDQPPAGQPGRRQLQQPASPTRTTPTSCTSTSPPTRRR